MALADYSLERFPEDLADRIEAIDGTNELQLGELDIDSEEQAHLKNVMIAAWIEQLATAVPSARSHFMPDHACVGLHHVDVVDSVQTDKFEVGFFHLITPYVIVPTAPFLTLFCWRVRELGFGVIWTSLGFRCEEISAEAEEAIYQRVLTAAAAAYDEVVVARSERADMGPPDPLQW